MENCKDNVSLPQALLLLQSEKAMELSKRSVITILS